MPFWRQIAIALTFSVGVLFSSASKVDAQAMQDNSASPSGHPAAKAFSPRWRAKLERIAGGRDRLSARLATVLEQLRDWSAAERPELLAELEMESPKAAAAGYGLLPQLVADEPESAGSAPLERRYGLAELEGWLAKEEGQVAELDLASRIRSSSLDRLVQSYRQRSENFRTLDAHVSYHFFWQGEVKKFPRFWQRNNELLALYRAWRTPVTTAADRVRVEEARRRLEGEMLQITPSPDLCLEKDEAGRMFLPVRVATDITDDAFLDAFAEGVERFWNDSPALRDAPLRILLAWDRRTPESLYPEGPPATGARLDREGHRQRFGSAALVLTTGSDSTHAFNGTVHLGAGRVSRRVLAHEFAHLLGLHDAYIRGYEGSPDDADGVIFREVTPFPESILASPASGRVTAALVDTLLVSYGRKGCASGFTEGGGDAPGRTAALQEINFGHP